MSTRLGSALASLWHGLLAYAVKFGVVGLIGLVIDVTLFNLLRFGVFGEDHWAQSAIGAKTISTSVAIIFNWLGNRYWTFRHHRRRNYVREFVEYVAVSIGGMLIALACLWVSHHWLGFTSIFADNVSTNVVGLALGTAFRFLLYRYWVYGHHRADGLSNLDRVEEAQRALFEEPTTKVRDAAASPFDANPPLDPVDALGAGSATADASVATQPPAAPSAGTTAGTPPRAS